MKQKRRRGKEESRNMVMPVGHRHYIMIHGRHQCDTQTGYQKPR